MPSFPARALAGIAFAALLASSSVLAQAPSPNGLPEAPQVFTLARPLTAEVADRLRAAEVEVLHYYGRGRYLLAGRPPSDLIATAPAKAAARPPAPAPAPRLSAYDAYPDLREAVAAGAERRYDVEVVLAFAAAVDYLGPAFAKTGFLPSATARPRSISVRGTIAAGQVPALLAHDYVLDIGAATVDRAILNDEARREHRVNVFHHGLADGLQLDGEEVVVGVGDGGKLSGHPDVADRVVYSTSQYNEGWGIHPDFVTGLIGADGIVDPRFCGNAPGAEFVIESSSAITYRAPSHYRDYGMTLTNNSYGPRFDCNAVGRYYFYAANLDQQAIDHPEILHVFASGNSAGHECEGSAGFPFGTLVAGGQIAKNTLTVGSAHTRRERYRSSSSGPTFDGRLKPELVAVGHDVVSNNRDRSYTGGSGTSYATPNVTGILALFTQHYRDLNDGRRPNADLLKALACNTATDVGRSGPDFEHGFGLVNALEGVRAISEATYDTAALPIGGTAVHPLTVVEGLEQLKVLLYWRDRPGVTNNAAPALVDDLDLALVTPAGDTLRPWVLDARSPGALPTRGRDSLNNIEQVTLDAPPAGAYRLVVASRRQDYGATDYVLTWSALAPSVQITQPLGGQSVDPQREIAIAWEGSPAQTGTWRVDYALVATGPDATKEAERTQWEVYRQDIPNLTRAIVFDAPGNYGLYRFRVVNEATGLSDETSGDVTLLAPPLQLVAADHCGQSARLIWEPKDGAVAYEVYRFDGRHMVPIATTATPEALVDGIPETGDALYSVAAIDAHGLRSERARGLFVAREPDGVCAKPLPIAWRDVSVGEEEAAVVVRWSVASEFESDYYEIERAEASPAGLSWLAVGQVAGRGTANTSADYAFEDPFAPYGVELHYRIRQVDTDGASATSATVVYQRASTTGERDAVVALSQNLIYAGLTVEVPAGRGTVTLDLFDVAGRRLRSVVLGEGVTPLEWSSGLARGTYLLRASGGGRTTIRHLPHL